MTTLLPRSTRSYDVDHHLLPSCDWLEAQEVGHLAPTVRRNESATVRECARAAIVALGGEVAPIGIAADGSPIWPPGYCGSMSHTAGYYAAAVGSTTSSLTLGIDAEANRSLPPDVLRLIADEEEWHAVTGLMAARPRVAWDRLLFSAKEAFFKAWYPITHEWLEFRDCQVTLDSVSRTFIASYSGERSRWPAVSQVEGRWRAVTIGTNSYIVTAIHVSTAGVVS